MDSWPDEGLGKWPTDRWAVTWEGLGMRVSNGTSKEGVRCLDISIRIDLSIIKTNLDQIHGPAFGHQWTLSLILLLQVEGGISIQD